MGSFADEIKWNVAEAINHLQAARELLESGQPDAAAARACESAFHMAGALLLDEGIEPDQHGDVITRIQEHFVQGRLLTKEQGSDLGWLFALRNVEDRTPSRSDLRAEKCRGSDAIPLCDI